MWILLGFWTGGTLGYMLENALQELHARIVNDVFVQEGEALLYKPNGDSAPGMFDFRNVVLSSSFLTLYAKLFLDKTRHMGEFQVCGLESTSLPLLAAITLEAKRSDRDVNAFFIRKSRKKDGSLNAIEGVINDTPIVLVDDILHSGASFQKQLVVLDALRSLQPETPHVSVVFPILTYKKKEAYTFLDERNIELLCFFTIHDFYMAFPELTRPELYTHTTTPLATKDLLWSFKSNDPNLFLVTKKASPVLGEGLLYVGGDDGTLYALDVVTGSVVFTYSFRKTSLTEKTFSQLVLTKNSLLFCASDKNLHAIDKQTGKVQWVFLESDILTTSIVYHKNNEVVFVVGELGLFKKKTALYAISTGNGKKIWELSDLVLTGPYMCYSSTRDILFVHDKCGTLYAVSGTNGKLLWKYGTGMVPSASPALSLDENYLVISGVEGSTVSITTFDIRKKKNISSYKAILYEVTGTPYIENDSVIVGGLDGRVHAFSLVSGKVLWITEVRGRIIASPRSVDGDIYIGTTFGALYRLQKGDGKIIDQVIISERIVSEGVHDPISKVYFLQSSAQEVYALHDKK